MMHTRVMATHTPDQTDALTDLDSATAAYRAAEQALENARERVHDAIVRTLTTGIGPVETARHSPYQRNHVERIRDAAGIPKRR